MGVWDRVRGLFTRAPAIHVDAGSLLRQLPLSLQLQRLGGNLTPHQVSNVFREADLGQMSRLVDLANDARQKDCHLQSVLHTRETALCGLEWKVEPAKKPGRQNATARDKDVGEFVEQALRQATGRDGDLEARGFTDLIAHLTGAAYYGYAVPETAWKRDGSQLVPEAFYLHSPRRFNFLQDSGRLVQWDILGGGQPLDVLAKFPGCFIPHQPRINGDVPCREGLVRPLMWTALFRNWDIRDYLSLAELAWKPWRTGMYKKGAGKEDINNLIAILESMTASGVAVYPDSTEVKVEWPRAGMVGDSAHQALADFLGAEMSKAVLGQTLTTEQGKVGSQALGLVHDEVRKDIREGDARSVAAAIRRHLIGPLVRWNFGDGVPLPDFCFVTEDAADLLPFAQGVEALVAAGVRVPAAWVYDEAGIPEPDDDDEIVGEAEVEVDTSGLNDPAAPAPPSAPAPAPAPAPSPPPAAPPAKAEVDVVVRVDAQPAPVAPAPAPIEPTFAERNASYLADMKDEKALGAEITQQLADELAQKHGVDPMRLP